MSTVIDFSKHYTPRPKQSYAHRSRVKYLLFGGAMGGGKSYWLCAEAIRNAMKYPGNRLVIIRKELTVLKRTTLISFLSICPPGIIGSFNQTSQEVRFINGSVLTFMEANTSRDPLLQKLKGLEIGWFGIDEANEISKTAYDILKTRLRWILPNGSSPRYEGRLTSNPENCWLIPTFITSDHPDELYIQAVTIDNYNEDDPYVLTLKEAFKDNPALARKYMDGDWSQTESINQLISSENLVKCQNFIGNGYGTCLGIDVARYGDDRTVFILIKEGNIEKIESYERTSTTDVVTKTIEFINEYDLQPQAIAIDGVGIGAGVIDQLHSMCYYVTEIQAGAAPVELNEQDAFKPFNLRSQIYYQLMKDMRAGEIGGITHEGLKYELSTIRYEIVSDKTVKVISKDLIKKVNGRSPDLADALAMANWIRVERSGNTIALPFYAGS